MRTAHRFLPSLSAFVPAYQLSSIIYHRADHPAKSAKMSFNNFPLTKLPVALVI
jgi:hypothetical protein